MKKMLVFAISLVLLLAVTSAAFAKEQHSNILLNRIVIIEDSPQVLTSVSVENIANDNSFDFNNGKVVILLPELGVRASGKLSVTSGKHESEKVLVDIPEGVSPGDYWMRITVTNEDVTRVRHRVITI